MTWFITIIVLLIAAILLILFLNRYYRKATREVALVRTGQGGQRVVLDGGCIAVPFLHKVSEINMRTSKLEIERVGPKSVITADRLRVDVGAEFYVRVDATEKGVATAAQALAGKTFRASELADTLEQQTATTDILEVINESQTDVQPVFQAIAENARKLTLGTSAHVGILNDKLITLAARWPLRREPASRVSRGEFHPSAAHR